jgi:hypothetical protein
MQLPGVAISSISEEARVHFGTDPIGGGFAAPYVMVTNLALPSNGAIATVEDRSEARLRRYGEVYNVLEPGVLYFEFDLPYSNDPVLRTNPNAAIRMLAAAEFGDARSPWLVTVAGFDPSERDALVAEASRAVLAIRAMTSLPVVRQIDLEHLLSPTTLSCKVYQS